MALYRRYRPETFAEVIGQDHVTEPLRNALAGDRVNHAYLFSGPRGCGKTTSARILARALNCQQAPAADPCGSCDSCRDLARGGGGSIDVIEIDAASHGGVDDARDLREKAFFAPVRDRFKIYIIDEAHMVSTQGFNALLKLVEEPPPHLRFIFATTEPEKVLPTIRSRTHHYPFRLIPPRQLSTYLSQLCDAEGVTIEPAALPLVVRAGGGSARDSLSVLDQLMGGAGPDGVTYDLAAALLGFTPETLLDEVVDAFAAVDGAAVFGVVDKVVETGRDPRRFTEDLLRRLRDLVIVSAVPDAPATGLLDLPQDAAERLVAQAGRFGAVELSRAADIVAAGLTEMRGATAPRLLLELICARVLLPGADDTSQGVMARLDRIERRLDVAGEVTTGRPPRAAERPAPVQAPAPAPAEPAAPAEPPVQPPAQPAAQPAARADSPPPAQGAPSGQPEPDGGPQPRRDEHEPMFAPARFDDDDDDAGGPAAQPAPAASTGSAVPVEAPTAPAPAPAGETPAGSTLTLVDVRRLWPDIVAATMNLRRVTWMTLRDHAQVVGVEAGSLTVGINNPGAFSSFTAGGSEEILRQAAINVAGVDWRINAILDPGAQPEGDRPVVRKPATAGGSAAPEPPAEPPAESPPPDWASEQTGSSGLSAAREALVRSRTEGSDPGTRVDHRALADEAADPDDPAPDTQGLDSTQLLQQALGAKVVDEIKHT
ncbi:DNA polymerase III subunit gamma and tau [Nocardioides piscis]|uniref:DNA polymerase III subunit gamma/tau n=1 Tax=Nocardioides piscis TaxID=2714938 RepID=A0A6G7YKH7_9ACTN|nr:DNA polymerase III subunit gamma and tau [Nocardioides piscis]